MVLHGIAYLSTYTMDKKCTNVIVLTCFPLFTDWYLNLRELYVDLYLRLQNKLPKRFRLQKKRKSHTLPGHCYSLLHSWLAEQRTGWVACSRPDISAMAVSCSNGDFENSCPAQPHPRKSTISYKYIHSFQILFRAVCVHRQYCPGASGDINKKNRSRKTKQANKQNNFLLLLSFCTLCFYKSGFICFLSFLGLCFPWSTFFFFVCLCNRTFRFQ